MSDVESPCIGLCRLDDADLLCLGCFRTLDEIGCWSTAAAAEQRAIVAAAEARKSRVAGPGATTG